MPYHVTIETVEDQYEITVAQAKFEEGSIKLIGLDPSLYPEEIRDNFRFYSKNLTAMPKGSAPEMSYNVTPTRDKIPKPDVYM